MKKYMAKRLWKKAVTHRLSDGGWMVERAIYAAKLCGNLNYNLKNFYPE